MVTFELGLEVGIGVYVKREEKGILRRFNTKKKKKDRNGWKYGMGSGENCVRIELGCRGIQKNDKRPVFSSRDFLF